MGVIEDDWDVRPTAGEGRKVQFAMVEAWCNNPKIHTPKNTNYKIFLETPM